METRVHITTFRVDRKCQICDIGNLQYTGNNGTIEQPDKAYTHNCDHCGIQTTMHGKIYPKYELKENQEG